MDLVRVGSLPGEKVVGRKDKGDKCMWGSDSSDVPWKLRWIKKKLKNQIVLKNARVNGLNHPLGLKNCEDVLLKKQQKNQTRKIRVGDQRVEFL